MIVKRVYNKTDPILWSIAQAEKCNNPIIINDEWLFFKSFTKRGNDVVVEFEKVDAKPVDHNEVEQKLRDALSNF